MVLRNYTLHEALRVACGSRAAKVIEVVQHIWRSAKRITALGPHFY
jgi:hypothetical protein